MNLVAKQFIQYSTLGIVAFIVDLLLLKFLLTFTPVWYPLAVGFSYWLASSGHYIGNRVWTFRGTRTRMWTAYLSYLSVNMVSIGVLSLSVWVSVEYGDISVVTARVICGGLVSVMAFALQRIITFRVSDTI